MTRACMHCGGDVGGRRSPMCAPCLQQHWKKRHNASAKLFKAVHSGVIAPARGQACVDCGNAADRYDHRDYSQPLQVQPVCAGCNSRRGPASWGRPVLDVAKAVA